MIPVVFLCDSYINDGAFGMLYGFVFVSVSLLPAGVCLFSTPGKTVPYPERFWPTRCRHPTVAVPEVPDQIQSVSSRLQT